MAAWQQPPPFLSQLYILGPREAEQLKPGRYLRFLLTAGNRLGNGWESVGNVWKDRCFRVEDYLHRFGGNELERFWGECNGRLLLC